MIDSDIPPTDFSKKFVSKTWLDEFERTGRGWLRILSGSMIPLIHTGDSIFIERVAPSNIRIGDVITFWKGRILVTHRIIKKICKGNEIFFIERGDQHSSYSTIPSSSVIGKVQQIKKGECIYFLNSLTWRIYNRLTGIALLCTFQVRQISHKIHAPVPIKTLAKKVLTVFKRLIETVCRILMHTYQKKS
jgi:signal peptidase I